MTSNYSKGFGKRLAAGLVLAAYLPVSFAAAIEGVTILHVGDQESWLLSAQGNLRNSSTDPLSFYGGIDRLATVVAQERQTAASASRSVLTLNAGDSFLPGPRFTASLQNLGTGFNGGQDFYDAIAMRRIGFTASVFGNHEFDLGPGTAARFAEVSGTTFLSSNLNFSATPQFQALAAANRVAPGMIVTTDGGNKIGLVGATTPLLPTISSPGAVNLLGYSASNTEQQNLQALVPIVQAQVDALRTQGATTIVLMSHLQNAANEINTVVPQLRGVDVVLSGGGHELMANTSDARIPGTPAPSYNQYPTTVTTADGNKALIVTSNFGNRYVGVLNLSLDSNGRPIRDAGGAPVVDTGSRMVRVSGAAADADRVTGDTFITNNVVTPVQNYIAALNAVTIGNSSTALNGARGAASSTTAPITFGVRNSETNLGNLMADALRFAGKTDVAFQNGGGIRASIAAGQVTVGDTFNVAPFTNLLALFNSVTPQQLKSILEHGLGAASPTGNADGRFPQISGMRVIYDTTRAIGSRILSITLNDGTVLVNDGQVIAGARNITMSTIDFLARGGDGYPFSNLGLQFVNPTNSITYQEALRLFIESPVRDGGLGGVISALQYGVDNPRDFQGRLVDLAIAVPTPATLSLLLLAGLPLLWSRRRAANSAGYSRAA